ncbi:MAG: mucoidy inhibitor MuiA family protein, partial [Proteobacteria bacterium]|nr:mucoidy inhibitor MuiA family protein [Pseudomonadota bacterium]
MPRLQLWGGAFAASFVLFIATAAQSEVAERQLDDQIEAVTLYSDQALIRREAKLRLAKGQHRVSFAPLPQAFEPSSVRVLVEGGRLLAFEIVRGYGQEELPPELQQRRDRLEQLEREIALIDGKHAVMAEEITFLTNLPPANPTRGEDGSVPKVDATTQGRVLDWAASRLAKAGDTIADLDLERVELVDEREVIVSELTGTRGAGAALARSRAVAVVDVERDANVELTLVYRTYQARWVPSYDVRLETGSDEVEVGIAAQVWQQTDEDWDEVELEMSTAVPSQSANLPELMAWFIEETPPPPPTPQPGYFAPEEDYYKEEERSAKVRSSERSGSSAKRAAAPPPPRSAPARRNHYAAEEAEYDDDFDEIYYEEPMEPPMAVAGLLDTGAYDGRADAFASALLKAPPKQDRSGPLLSTNQRAALMLGQSMPFVPSTRLSGQRVTSTDLTAWDAHRPASNAMGFDFSFAAQRRTTIPSDGQVHRVPLTVRKFPARMEHIVVPVIDEAVYVRAIVDNGGPFPMLAGMSDVFVDGGYLGRVPTQTVAAGQPLELALGIDRQVKVKRRQEQLSDKGGIVGSSKLRVYEVAVELENYHQRQIQVRVLDRVPYTYDNDIKL